MKNVRLNNGVMMPAIGFGVFQIPENETERAVNDAIEIGYRKFDTAAAYFNEEQLGNAIRQSGIKREEFFITTKLWVQDYEYDDALRAFDLSMKKLGLDYLDLYLMHKPYGNYYAAWRAMERLYKEGRIRAIGVTSFSNERLQDLFWFFVKFGGNLFFISTVFFFLNPIKSCRYVCFLVTLKTPHH